MKAQEGSAPACTPLHIGGKSDPHPVPEAQLRELGFFEGFSDAHFAELRPHTKTSYFEPGQPVLAQGELANRFYVIVSGRVAIECKVGDQTFPVQVIGPGEVVGFSWCFTPERLHFTARAIEPVKAIFFYGTLLREDCELDSTLGYEIILRMGRVLMQRMEALVDLLATQGKDVAPGGSALARET